MPPQAENNPGRGVDDRLESAQLVRRKSEKDTVAVVQSREYKSADKMNGGRYCYVTTDIVIVDIDMT